ncbi:2TM domain-containing protein [Tenacibaculum halocynthiae]|uniref:2TM domain-containing protein n=1 Tax=Tenacibaculum halocynthiae TaxID=1254437 RepID=UPI003D65EA51
MEKDYTKEHKYLLAKKKVEKIKGFYWHLISYIVVNVFISSMVIFGLMSDDEDSLIEVLQNFGVYSTWVFWGIGLFFHWLGVYGDSLFFNKDWEKRKIDEYMKNDE